MCVRRKSSGFFSQLSGITSVYVSASAAAQAPGCAIQDIVMVLDNSGSIGEGELVQLKTAATTLIDEFCLDDVDGVRAGITRFASSSVPLHDMSVDATSLNAAIDGIIQGGADIGGKTNIVAGLNVAAAQYSSGPGDRSNAPNRMIFITDGNDTLDNSDADIALASLATGAEIFAIGVGDVGKTTLDAIATDPDADHSFLVADFEALLLLFKGAIGAAFRDGGQILIE